MNVSGTDHAGIFNDSHFALYNMSTASSGFCLYISTLPNYLDIETVRYMAQYFGCCLEVVEVAPCLIKVLMRWHEDASQLHDFIKRAGYLCSKMRNSEVQHTVPPWTKPNTIRVWHTVRAGGQRDIGGPSAVYVRFPLDTSLQNFVEMFKKYVDCKYLSYVPAIHSVSYISERNDESDNSFFPSSLEARFDCSTSYDAVCIYKLLMNHPFHEEGTSSSNKLPMCTLGVLGSTSDGSSTDDSDASTWWDSSDSSESDEEAPPGSQKNPENVMSENPGYMSPPQSCTQEPQSTSSDSSKPVTPKLLKAHKLFEALQANISQLRWWKLVRCINQGNNAVVYLAQHIHPHTHECTWSAIKIMRRSSILYISKELECLKAACGYPTLSQILFHGHSETYACIVLHYLGTDLAQLTTEMSASRSTIKCIGAVSDLYALLCLKGMLRALADLHRLGYLHKSVKPENFCLRSTSKKEYEDVETELTRVVLIDFGRVERVNETDDSMCDWRAFHGWWYSYAAISGMRQYALDDVYSAVVSAVSLKWSVCRQKPSFSKRRKKYISTVQRKLRSEIERTLMLNVSTRAIHSLSDSHEDLAMRIDAPVPPEDQSIFSTSWSAEVFRIVREQRKCDPLLNQPDYDALIKAVDVHLRLCRDSCPHAIDELAKLINGSPSQSEGVQKESSVSTGQKKCQRENQLELFVPSNKRLKK